MAKIKKPEQAIFYQNFKGAIYGGTPKQVKNLMTAFCQYAFVSRMRCYLPAKSLVVRFLLIKVHDTNHKTRYGLISLFRYNLIRSF